MGGYFDYKFKCKSRGKGAGLSILSVKWVFERRMELTRYNDSRYLENRLMKYKKGNYLNC